ncbi:hypothetical protein HYPSUDRAFT_763600 [Hypholoma sublateritium FD-334 SS-4]|uniref:Uncharacterized protein n=1 Tax=Hypholoma sublateritium (strain FD-334 SS-4) TaxID=945553 RepID=A0A0D2L2J1_HYPSF|nr:hypothetical protein HYPSUDRAFT_763600 [Hypholoma sublateritium FD-334 SS-4]
MYCRAAPAASVCVNRHTLPDESRWRTLRGPERVGSAETEREEMAIPRAPPGSRPRPRARAFPYDSLSNLIRTATALPHCRRGPRRVIVSEHAAHCSVAPSPNRYRTLPAGPLSAELCSPLRDTHRAFRVWLRSCAVLSGRSLPTRAISSCSLRPRLHRTALDSGTHRPHPLPRSRPRFPASIASPLRLPSPPAHAVA